MYIVCTVHTVQYNTVQYGTLQYSTVQYEIESTEQYSTVQYSKICTQMRGYSQRDSLAHSDSVKHTRVVSVSTIHMSVQQVSTWGL